MKRHYHKLDYRQYLDAFQNGRLEVSIASQYRRPLSDVHALSSDPDHGGRVTISSLIETMTAFEFESTDILGMTVRRGPKRTDLIDNWNRKWDVKTPPSLNDIRFDINAVMNSVITKFNSFPDENLGIMLNISFLCQNDYDTLQTELLNNLTENQLFRLRHVYTNGVFKPTNEIVTINAL